MKRFEVWEEPFPENIRNITPGITMLSEKLGHYVILLDSNLEKEKREIVLKHELSHIFLEHLEHHGRTRTDIEAEANDYASQMTEAEFAYLMTYQLIP